MRVTVEAEGRPARVVVEHRGRGGRYVSNPMEIPAGKQAEIPDIPAGGYVHVQEVGDALSGA